MAFLRKLLPLSFFVAILHHASTSTLDAPGAFHHIICRGLERRRIFQDDVDRNNFISRLATIIQQTSTLCFAWVLIPNHFHILKFSVGSD
jgi:REP element-mobilizing transposase RayT